MPARTRKKQPDLTRQQLLDVAGGIVLAEGVGGLTLDAVAKAAGISKGGLLHHFPSKQALIVALIEDLGARHEREIEEIVAADEVPCGRTARAFVRATARHQGDGHCKLWAMLSMEILNVPELRERWRVCLASHLDGEGAAGADPVAATIARLAADGLWLADLVGVFDDKPDLRRRVLERLTAMTLERRDGGTPAT